MSSPPDLETLKLLVDMMRDPRDKKTVAEIVRAYLENARDDICAEHFVNRRATLTRFSDRYGTMTVLECNPLLVKEFLKDNPQWASGHTRRGVYSSIRRAFSWAVAMRVIRENPFRGLALNESDRPTGRDMKPGEFQALMRHAPAFFKRFLMALRMTGARPGELRRLRWKHIRWEQGTAVLGKDEHKTGKKTGDDRVIILVQPMLKLLAFIQREQRASLTSAIATALMTFGQPVRRKGAVVAYRMEARALHGYVKNLGVSYAALHLARVRLGVISHGGGGATMHELAADLAKAAILPATDYVFLGINDQPLKGPAIHMVFSGLRKKLGLPDDCKLYSLRHFWITAAVKRGVNLKAIAIMAGHKTTYQVEHTYCHLSGDLAFLHAAAAQATGMAQAAPATPSSPTPTPEQPEPIYPKAAPLAQKEKKMPPRYRAALDLYRLAIERNPSLASAADGEVYAWLAAQPGLKGLPDSAETFRVYLARARTFLDPEHSADRSRTGAKRGARRRWAKA